MMSVSTLFISFDVVSCVLICLATLGIVVGLVDFCFLLSILCVLLILSRLIRATISAFFVPCCPVLLSFYLSYLTCLNLINGMEWNGKDVVVKTFTFAISSPDEFLVYVRDFTWTYVASDGPVIYVKQKESNACYVL